MALTETDLAWIRDEIGTAVPPSNGQLEESFDELGTRAKVALRILKRRYADLAGGEVGSVSLAGVASVTLRSNLAAMQRSIERLQGLVDEEDGAAGVPGARVRHLTRSWR